MTLTSRADAIFAPLARLAPRSTWARVALSLLDAVLFNLIFYKLLRSILLQPIGNASKLDIAIWLSLLVIALFVLHGLRSSASRWRLVGFVAQLALVGAFCGALAVAAGNVSSGKGVDFSWLRVEIVKVPLWIEMFGKACPGFTALAIGAAGLLAWGSIAAPRSRLLRAAPGVLLLGVSVLIARSFLSLPEGPSKAGFYTAAFSGPLLVFWALFACGAFGPAFRVFPFVLHTLYIAFNYVGLIPVHLLAPEFVTEPSAGGPSRTNQHGVTKLFPSGDGEPGASFRFLRKMVLSREEAYFSYGPTCGIYAVHRETGALREIVIPGLIRDLGWSPDNGSLWATNWMNGDFIAVNPRSMERTCVVDMFRDGLTSPWGFVVDAEGDRVYISNVTLPIVAEATVRVSESACSVTVGRSVDFHQIGYTRFTDGAFGLHVDRARDRLYVLVGMLDGKFEMGLVELELGSFKVLRDLRLPAGTLLVPVRGSDTALLTSYYRDDVFEVSLSSMKLVRTMHAAPTITAIEQDEKRGVFYATSRTTGELLVIDDARGEVVRTFAVGAKPEALRLDREADQLFLGSGRGVFRIDLGRFMAPR